MEVNGAVVSSLYIFAWAFLLLFNKSYILSEKSDAKKMLNVFLHKEHVFYGVHF